MADEPSPPSPAELHRWRMVLAAIAFAYLYFIPFFPAVNNPAENARIYQVRAMVEQHRLSVDDMVKRYGWVNDLAARAGRTYPNKAPGTALVGAAIYGAVRAVERLRGHAEVSTFELTWVLRLFGVQLPVLFFLSRFRRLVRRVVEEEHVANLLAATLALGTMVLPYSLMFTNHGLSAASAFGSVIATRAAAGAGTARARLAYLALSGFLLSFTASIDYSLLPVAVFLLAFAIWRVGAALPSLAAISAGASLPAGWTAWYHRVCWGSPFRTSLSYLTNKHFAEYASEGFFGLVGPSRDSLGLLVSRRGLFYVAPVFALGLLATAAALRSRRFRKEAVLSAAVTGWVLAYGISLINWHGGWSVGPRYVTVISPFVVFAMAVAWRELGAAWRRRLLPPVVALSLVSILFVGGASVLFPHLVPHFRNPLFEMVWPLWQGGITPYSLGYLLFGWRGHLDQLPFLVVGGGLLAYLAWIRAGTSVAPRPARRVALASALATLLCAGGLIALWSIPRTDPAVRTDATAWLRRTLWAPPLPDAALLPAPRAPMF